MDEENFDYFQQYMSQRDIETQELNKILCNRGEIRDAMLDEGEQVDYCDTFIDQIADLKQLDQSVHSQQGCRTVPDNVQEQLLRTLKEEELRTRQTIQEEEQRDLQLIQQKIDESEPDMKKLPSADGREATVVMDEFLEHMDRDMQQQNDYFEHAYQLQTRLQEIMTAHDSAVGQLHEQRLARQRRYARGGVVASCTTQQCSINVDIMNRPFELNVDRGRVQQGYDFYAGIPGCLQDLESKLAQQTTVTPLQLPKRTSIQTIVLPDLHAQVLGGVLGQHLVIACISGQNLDNEIFRTISVCTQLCELDISRNRLTALSFETQHPYLQVLKAADNNIMHVQEDILDRCPRLQVIDVAGNQLSDTDARRLLRLPLLRDANLGANSLSSAFLTAPLAVLGLQYLSITKVALNYQGMTCYFPNLLFLGLEQPIPFEILPRLRAIAPRLQTIEYSDAPGYMLQPSQCSMIGAVLGNLRRINNCQLPPHGTRPTLTQLPVYTQDVVPNFCVKEYHHASRHAATIEKVLQLPILGKFYTAILRSDQHINYVLAQLGALMGVRIIPGETPNKQTFTDIVRCYSMLQRAIVLDHVQRGELCVEPNEDMRLRLLVMPNAIKIQKFYKKDAARHKLHQALAGGRVLEKIRVFRALVKARQHCECVSKDIHARQEQRQIEEQQKIEGEKKLREKKEKLQQMGDLLAKVDEQLAVQQSIQSSLRVVQRLADTAHNNMLFARQYGQMVHLQQILSVVLQRHVFAKRLEQKLAEARERLNDRQKLLHALDNEYTFDDAGEDIAALTRQALDDAEDAFDQGVRSQMDSILIEQTQKEPQIAPRHGITESSQLGSHSQLIGSVLEDVSCIEDRTVVSNALQTAQHKHQQPEQHRSYQELARRVAARDGWEFESDQTALAYYKIVQRNKKLLKKGTK